MKSMETSLKGKIVLALGALAVSSLTSSATILTGWDTWSETAAGNDTINATVLTSGFTGQSVGSAHAGSFGWGSWGASGAHGFGGSTDGTWGTVADSAPSILTNVQTVAVGLLNATDFGELTITIFNGTGSDYLLTGFHFDGVEVRTDAPQNWALSVLSGGISLGAVAGGSGTLLQDNLTPFLDRGNYDISLLGLSDNTLEAGASVVFQLAFTGGSTTSTSGGQNAMIDNLALAGTIVVVPEPSTVGIFALSAVGLLVRRRRA